VKVFDPSKRNFSLQFLQEGVPESIMSSEGLEKEPAYMIRGPSVTMPWMTNFYLDELCEVSHTDYFRIVLVKNQTLLMASIHLAQISEKAVWISCAVSYLYFSSKGKEFKNCFVYFVNLFQFYEL